MNNYGTLAEGKTQCPPKRLGSFNACFLFHYSHHCW